MTNLEKYYDDIVDKAILFSRHVSNLSAEEAVFVAVAIVANDQGFENDAIRRSQAIFDLLKWMKEPSDEGTSNG